MAQKTKDRKSISEAIRDHFKTQSWLAIQTGISEPQLSRKLNETKPWTQEDLDKINKVLGTKFKL